MKRSIVLTAILALCSLAIVAQEKAATPNFSGVWTLDVQNSQLGEREHIEAQTLTVKQTTNDLKVETATKRTPPPTVNPGGAPAGTERGKPRMGGGGTIGSPRFGIGDMPWTYTLDGKDTKGEMQGPMGAMPVTLNAKFDGPKLNISRTSTFNGPMGEVTMTTRETWYVSTDGKTLTINAERTSLRGTESATRVYIRKEQK